MSNRLQALERALAELEREGALSAEQRSLVAARLRAVWNERRVDFAAVVAAFGGLLIAAGLLYLVGYNWELLGKAAKLAIVFGVWFGLHWAGWRLTERGEHPLVGRGLTLAAVAAFGGALGLVAQIYNLSAHYPHAALLWWTLSIPIALATRSRAVLELVLALALVWAGWHTGVWIEDQPRPQFAAWLANFTLVGAALAALLAALVALCDGTRFAAFAPTLRRPIVLLAASAPFVLAFEEAWTGAHAGWPDADAAVGAGELLARLTPVWAACGAAALVLAVATLRARGAHVAIGWGLLAATVALALLALFAPYWLPLVANLVLFGGALTAIALAARLGRAPLATAGVVLFLAGVVARYFEYLWDKLDGAFAFLATGALLLGVAWVFERGRRAARTQLGALNQ
ncbi:MAG: DUF2157 domain-containing protein [Planctomycetes bacterium]|nr:DUF2157 domain-containing protein [Planctomycetota bacterium]